MKKEIEETLEKLGAWVEKQPEFVQQTILGFIVLFMAAAILGAFIGSIFLLSILPGWAAIILVISFVAWIVGVFMTNL